MLVKVDSVDYFREAEEVFQHSSYSQDKSQDGGAGGSGGGIRGSDAFGGTGKQPAFGIDDVPATAAGTRLEDLPALTDMQRAEAETLGLFTEGDLSEADCEIMIRVHKVRFCAL